MLDTVEINHVQHISFTQSRLTDAVSVILSELLSYEHPSKVRGLLLCLLNFSFPPLAGFPDLPIQETSCRERPAAPGLAFHPCGRPTHRSACSHPIYPYLCARQNWATGSAAEIQLFQICRCNTSGSDCQKQLVYCGTRITRLGI